MAIEYFCCYHSYRRKVAKLSDQEVGRLFRALLAYSETGEAPELAGRESVAFDFIADDIDRAKEAYRAKCEQNKRNRSSTTVGGRPQPSTDGGKNKDKTKDKENPPQPPEGGRSVGFAAPSVEEVREYCRERNNGIDPEEFVAFYASKGWMVGKNRMTDWKKAVITWEKKRRQQSEPGGGDGYDVEWK